MPSRREFLARSELDRLTPGQIGFLDILAKAEGRIHFAGEHASPWTG